MNSDWPCKILLRSKSLFSPFQGREVHSTFHKFIPRYPRTDCIPSLQSVPYSGSHIPSILRPLVAPCLNFAARQTAAVDVQIATFLFPQPRSSQDGAVSICALAAVGKSGRVTDSCGLTVSAI